MLTTGIAMRRIWIWLGDSSDALIALCLAIAVSILDLVGIGSTTLVYNGTLLTLAVVAFSIIRERSHRATIERSTAEIVDRIHTDIQSLPRRISDDNLVRVLSGSEIDDALAEARADTGRWVFRGSTATFVRVVTLPECVSRARGSRQALTVKLDILDPTDVDLCDRYTRMYRNITSHQDAPEHSWTADGTRRELFATILAACWHRERYDLLDLEVCLASTFSTFRYELSDTDLIITQRGPDFPALLIKKGSPLFDTWRAELHMASQQSRLLSLGAARNMHLSDNPAPQEVRDLFAAIDVELPVEYDDEVVLDISRKALQDNPPYSGG